MVSELISASGSSGLSHGLDTVLCSRVSHFSSHSASLHPGPGCSKPD